MRSKAPLALMEQLVMVLVFALSAACCLQIFAAARQISRNNEALSRAVLEAQNTAEWLKAGGEDWHSVETDEESSYVIEIEELPETTAGLKRVEIRVKVIDVDKDRSEVLFRLPVAWQEVDADA